MKILVFSINFLISLLFICFNAAAQPGIDRYKPEPSHWYAGDMHVHRNCGTDSIVDVKKLANMMEENDLAVISVLADMGNAEVKDSKTDLRKVTGNPAAESTPGRIVNWDVEWHWDATYSQFQNQALGGHLVLLGLKEAHQIWKESPYKILDWGKKQNAVSGFAHMQYLNDSIQSKLNCCIPVDYPVEAALGTIDFISEDVFGSISPNNGNYFSDGAINAYYKLLNCGFRMSLVAGTDYPCNNDEPLGTLLTYVEVPAKELTYQNWVEGIRQGKTVVSRNAHKEFLDLKVNGSEGPGSIINIKDRKELNISVNWTANENISGWVELVSNGKVIARQDGTVRPGEPILLTTTQSFTQSGWICARRMSASGHMLHTSPTYVSVNDRPVRASAADAEFFTNWIDNILDKIKPGSEWNKYFPNDYKTVRKRYLKARNIYRKIRNEVAVKSEK